jgi:transposase
VNPFHLFLGTQKDNVDDCASKGRRNQVRYTKLDPEQRDEIKRLYATGEWTFAALGRKFGVTYQSIRWHVT